jgi:hypothetical protein
MRVKVDGKIIVVPDDATPDEIDQLTRPPAPPDLLRAAGDALPEAAKSIAGAGGAFIGHASNSAMAGFGDEAVGGYKALVKKLTGDKRPMGEIYHENRDAVRAALDADQKEHPVAAFAGDVAGGAVDAAALPAGAGATLLRALATGAGLGGANALGASKEETAGGMAKDAALGAGVGAAFGGGGKLAIDALPGLAAKARDVAVSQGRRVLTGGANPLAVKQPLSEEAVLEAFKQGAIKPLSNVRTANAVLEKSREDLGQQYAQILEQLEAKGVTGPQAQQLAHDLLAESQTLSANSLNSPKPALFQGTAEELAGKPVDAQGRLGLMQAENMKRTLQREATYGNVTDKLGNEAKKDIASRMRAAIEDEVAAQAGKAPQESAAFEPVKDQLSRVIEASNAAQKGAAQYERRAALGLPEYIMGAGELASGHPLRGAATLGITKLLRSRMASTNAVGAKKTADILEAILSPQTPEQKFLQDLIMRRSLPVGAELSGELAGQ